MTPKEKAIQLFNEFNISLIHEISHSASRNYSSYKCAVIAVDEIIEILSKDINPLINYWFEVKQELEALYDL